MLEAAANPILAARRALRQELAGLEKVLRNHAKEDPVCRTLMTMPGVGTLVALTVKAAIDDPERFRSSKDIGPWVGLTPRRAQSGERDFIGQVSRAGDIGLRTALYQAATVMLHRGRKNWLIAWALNVAKRRGKSAPLSHSPDGSGWFCIVCGRTARTSASPGKMSRKLRLYRCDSAMRVQNKVEI